MKLETFKKIIRSSFDKGFFHLLSSNFLIQFLGFGLILFLSKVLSPKEVGQIKLIQSYAAFFVIFGVFGFNSSILKVCSESISRFEKLRAFRYGLRKCFFFSVVSVFIFITFSFTYIKLVNPELVDWLVIYSFIIPFSAIGYCFSAYLQAQKKIKEVASVQSIVRLIFIFIVFVSGYLWGFGGVVFSTLVSYVVGTLIYLFYVDRSEIIGSTSTKKKLEIDLYSKYVFLGSAVTMVRQYSDMYLLDYLSADQSQVGFYSLATIFFLAGTVAVGSAQTIITPYMSERQNDFHWVYKKTLFYQLIVFLGSIFLALLLVMFMHILVKYYYGQSYNDVIEYGYLLICKFLVWSSYSIVGASLFGVGKVKEGFYVVLFTTPAGIWLGYRLFIEYDIVGVAYSQIIINLISAVIIFGIFYYYSLGGRYAKQEVR